MLIALHGPFGSGKNTVGTILEGDGFIQLAFADKLRELLLILDPIVTIKTERDSLNVPRLVRLREVIDTMGWDQAKQEYHEVRRLLQVFATDVVRRHIAADYWVEVVARQIAKKPNADYVITDLRFENEYAAVESFGGQVWVIDRPGHEYPTVVDATGHVSEAWHPPADETWTLVNDAGLDELAQIVKLVLTSTRNVV